VQDPPAPAEPVQVESKREVRRVIVVLAAALLAGVLLACAWHWRPGQDVQPKEQATIEYEPLANTGGSAGEGGESRYHRVLDRLRAWRSRRK
jgi:hypothetical protein